MSNKTQSGSVHRRTLSRLAALGGTALILTSILMTVGASGALAAEIVPSDIHRGTANPPLSSSVCNAADFNFVIDMSGSIGDQGPGRPENLTALKAGINGFVDAFALAGGDGRYAGVKFNDDSSSIITTTAGYKTADVFKPRVNLLSGPTGLTPTATGINMGAANDAGDRAGVPNVMFVLTDGSPNKPNTHGDDLTNKDTWLQAANAAVDAANAARAGSDKYVVNAVYLSTPTDPGDTNLPWDDAGDKAWATEVMDQIGGGSHFDANFNSFIKDLFKAIGCTPDLHLTKTADKATVNAGEQIGFTVKIDNQDKGTATGLAFTDNLPSGTGVSWSIDGSPAGWSITGSVPNQVLHYAPTTLDGNTSTSVHIVSNTTKDSCKAYLNSASVSAGNNATQQASATTTVKCASLDLTKTADNATVNAGEQIGFTVKIDNTGDGTATGIAFTDNLPGGTGVSWSINPPNTDWSITGSAPQVLHFVPTTLAGHASSQVHVVSNTTKDSCKAYPNSASVSSGNDGSDQASATTTVKCASLDLTKTADNATVNAGEQIGFTVKIDNTGDGTATGIAFTDNLPGGTGVSWSINPPNTDWSITGSAPQVLHFVPTTLAGHASSQVHVVSNTTKDSCKAYPNSASVSSGNDGSDQASATTTVKCASLDLTKTADNATVNAGEQIGFTVKIDNTGDGTATGIAFTDNLPGGTGVSWSINPPNTDWSITGSAPQVLHFVPTTLAGHASSQVHVVSNTTKDSCKAYPNSASVSSGNDGSDQASATTTVKCASLDLTKTADNATVNAGEQIGFTVKIDNTGDGTATGIAFTDNLPGGTGVSWSINPPNTDWSITGSAPQVLHFVPTTLAGHASSQVHVVSNTTKDSCKAYPNSASVSSGNDGSDQASATTTVNCADIQITKVADDHSVSAGDTIGFTIIVTNGGAGTATGVHVADLLPTDAGLDWTNGSVTGPSASGTTCGIAAGSLTCDRATLPSGGSFSVHISSPTTGATVATSPVTNSATVTTTNDGTDESHDAIEVLGASISIDKVADKDVVNAGELIGFTVTVSNGGPGQAKDVHVTDTLPTDGGLSWTLDDDAGGLCSLTIGVVTCDKATLDDQGSFAFHVSSSTAAATAEDSPVENEACVGTSNDGADCDDDQTQVLGADIQIAKVADDDSVSAGDTIGFTITVTNNGDGAATGVHVSDTLPTDAGLSWSKGPVTGPNASGVTCAITLGVLTCDKASLPSKGSFSVHISSPTTAATAAESPVENSASVTTTNDGSDESHDQVQVLAPNIDISKTADDEVVNAGETIGFSVTVSNGGPGQAKNVHVTDTVPTDAGLSWTLDDNAGGLCALAAGVVTCNAATLDSLDSFTFHVTSGTTAATAAESPVENEACVTASNENDNGACDDDQTQVLAADIGIVKEADASSVQAGGTIGFTVTVTNHGDGTAKDVVVTDTLPTDAGLSWSLNDDAGGKCALEAGVVTCNVATLGAGAHFSFHVTSSTTVETAGDSPVTNSACVTTGNDGEACGRDLTDVHVLALDKTNDAPIEALELPDHTTANLPTADEGDTVTYTLTYHVGASRVDGGVITDVLPEGVQYVVDSATDNDEFSFIGYDSGTRTLTWKAESVTEDGSVTYQALVLTGASELAQPLTNIATISSEETEPDSSTSDIYVPVIPQAETAVPTPPQTDVLDKSTTPSAPGSSLPLMLAILGGLMLGLSFVTPVPEAIRRRNRR